MHPDSDTLQQWLDDAVTDETVRAELGVHVPACPQCTAWVNTHRIVGDGLRAWADALPPLDTAFTDAILAAATRKDHDNGAASVALDRSTVLATEPGVSGAHGARGGEAPRALAARAPAARALAEGGGGRVLPLRRLLWPMLAVAAAAVLVVGGHRVRTPRVKGPGAPVAVLPAQPMEPAGASVARVDVVGAQSYAILEVPGLQDGSTTAVVWIQDDPEDTPSEQPPTAVQ